MKRYSKNQIAEMKGHLRDYVETVTERKGSGGNYVCPLCGSGNGPKGTPGFSVYADRSSGVLKWKCHACHEAGNIFELYGKINNEDSFAAQLAGIAGYLGIVPEESYEPGYLGAVSGASYAPPIILGAVKGHKVPAPGVQWPKTAKEEAAPMPKDGGAGNEAVAAHAEADYTDFFKAAAERIEETAYHRGLSVSTLDRFGVGYDPAWRYPLEAYLAKDKSRTPESWQRIPATPRLIIPTGEGSYIARLAEEEEYDDDGNKITNYPNAITKIKVGPSRLFNTEALGSKAAAVFIVEGEIDALSLENVGFSAVGMGSTSNKSALIEAVKQRMPNVPPLVLAMDNDEPGRKAAEELQPLLEEVGALVLPFSFPEGIKDANAFLRHDLLGLRDWADEKAQAATDAAALRKAELDAEIRRESAANALEGFAARVKTRGQCYPTGFAKLDAELGGGLYPGLYVVGAISSLGKTTFCLQLADNLAAAGHDVLIVSLEMSRDELIAKSLSRLTYRIAMGSDGNSQKAKTTRGILSGERWDGYSYAERETIQQAMTDYATYADKVFIWEGVGDIGTAEIKTRIAKHKAYTGRPPVVVIDYLQILKPEDVRLSDKQAVDHNVMELKRISRDYDTPVIVISSFNRDSYTQPVGLSSFKESGGVEYSSDVLIGLQYQGMDYDEKDGGGATATRMKRVRELIAEQKERAKKGRAQGVQLKILKNRNGSLGSVDLFFMPLFNDFSEHEPIDRYDGGISLPYMSPACSPDYIFLDEGDEGKEGSTEGEETLLF